MLLTVNDYPMTKVRQEIIVHAFNGLSLFPTQTVHMQIMCKSKMG